jgi:hypothetical protein
MAGRPQCKRTSMTSRLWQEGAWTERPFNGRDLLDCGGILGLGDRPFHGSGLQNESGDKILFEGSNKKGVTPEWPSEKESGEK